MPRALILNTASKANTTGGAWGDTLAVNSGDSLTVPNFNTGGAKVTEAWGINSDSVGEVRFIWTRPEATHDQNLGLRFNIPSLIPGGAAVVAAHNFLPGLATITLFKSDVVVITTTSTAADDVLVSWNSLIDDLPGAQAVLASWDQVQALHKSTVGIYVNPTASATPGAYGATRAFNADDDRLHANTWYAILGASFQTVVTTVRMIGPDWGGQAIGFPGGALDMRSDMWFVDQSIKWGVPLIPCFNSNNKGNILISIADGEASTVPKVDFLLYELTGMPGV